MGAVFLSEGSLPGLGVIFRSGFLVTLARSPRRVAGLGMILPFTSQLVVPGPHK